MIAAGAATGRAQPSNQALSQDTDQGRAHQIGLHMHVNKPDGCRNRIVGVQSRKHEMSGQARLNCHPGSLIVANLPDHDHVGVLS